MKVFSITYLFILIFSFTVFGQNTQSKVDEYVKKYMQNRQVPGVSLTIVEDGKITYAKGFGYANVEHQVPVKTDTIFQIASVGKQFTAAAVMLLVEDGKINLDDKISKYLKDTPEPWKDITVRHLLTHTSGLGDYPKDFDYRKDYTEEELFEIIKNSKLEFKPGEKWQYSNFGYVTLGILIRKVSGKFYGDYLQEKVFQPLKMDTARVISEADIIPNRASGYTLDNGKLKNQSWVSPSLNTTADGALYMTVKDLAKWDVALYGEKILKKSSLEQIWSPVKFNDGNTFPYGFGWSLGKVTGSRVFEHSGGWQGFSSHISRFVDEKTTVIVLSNLSQANSTQIARSVAEIYNPKLAPILEKAIEDKEPEVTKILTDILQRSIDGTIEKETFTEQAQEKLYPIIKPFVGSLNLGKIIKFELLERTEENDIRRYKYRVTFENSRNTIYFVMDKDNKLDGIAIQ